MELLESNRIITETYNNLRQPFLAFASHNYNLSKYDSEDIFHDTLIAFRQNLLDGKINNLKEPLKTYVFGIGKKKIVDHLRNRKKEDLDIPVEDYPIPVPPKDDDPESLIIERNEIVYREVSQMENPCKEILLLYYWHKKNMHEIAGQMNYSGSEVAKTQKNRCMKKISTILTKKLKEAELL